MSARAIDTMDSEAEDAGARGMAPSLYDHCFLTRGADADTWHLWNSSSSAVSLHKNDIVGVHLVRVDMEQTELCHVRIVRDIVVAGLKDRQCVVGLDIEHCVPLLDLPPAAAYTDLVQMCVSRGIKCATFLEHYVKSNCDEELDLGKRMHTLCVSVIQEMMDRKYDIMHHYPLFNRMISMYYSETDRTVPPSLQYAIRPGGLLDKSVREHESLHGLSVSGLDHLTFNSWNYPYEKPDNAAQEEVDSTLVSESKDVLVSNPCIFDTDEELAKVGKLELSDGCHQQQQQRPAAKVCSLPSATSETHAASGTRGLQRNESIHWFNNHPGVLTDRPAAFPYMFTVHVGQGVTFDDLVTYCITREPEVQIGTLPVRREWGAVNPVLLMEDTTDPNSGKIVRSYAVTSRGHLSELTTRPCYNEVFLPNRPVTRLNLDMKCCVLCRDRYTVNANNEIKRKLGRAIASSIILMIAETLLSMANVIASKQQSTETGAVHLKELVRDIGKVSIYIRSSPDKNKLSLRVLWYLPMELCSIRGIEAYKPLLQEMEKMSLRYVLLSYPDESRSCGLCQLSKSITRNNAANNGRILRLNANACQKRRSAVDKAPYSLRKSVRLPNCYKENTRFEYVETFNDQVNLHGSGFDGHRSLSVGLSSNPIAEDITFLGDRFSDILEERKVSLTVGFEAYATPDLKRVQNQAAELMVMWGVPVTIKKTSTGLFCVQATEKSTTYPCPKHNRVHSTCKLSALVFATQTIHKCFVP